MERRSREGYSKAGLMLWPGLPISKIILITNVPLSFLKGERNFVRLSMQNFKPLRRPWNLSLEKKNRTRAPRKLNVCRGEKGVWGDFLKYAFQTWGHSIPFCMYANIVQIYLCKGLSQNIIRPLLVVRAYAIAHCHELDQAFHLLSSHWSLEWGGKFCHKKWWYPQGIWKSHFFLIEGVKTQHFCRFKFSRRSSETHNNLCPSRFPQVCPDFLSMSRFAFLHT